MLYNIDTITGGRRNVSLSDYKLTKEEIETNINFCSADKDATIYTCSPVMIRRMDKLLEKFPQDVKLIAEDKYSKTYTVPKGWVMKIRPPRQLSEEQKEKLRENMLKIHSEKNEI